MRWKFPKNYDENWDEIREYVFKRDDYTCQVEDCGASRHDNPNLELHCAHIMPKSKGGKDIYSNLETRSEIAIKKNILG